MTYFHTDDPSLMSTLGYLLTEGAKQGGRIRFDVDENGNLKYKVAEGMWSPPIRSTPDPYRDQGHFPDGTERGNHP